MKRYRFSNGQISVDDRILVKPKQANHPLEPTPIWVRLTDEGFVPLSYIRLQQAQEANRTHEQHHITPGQRKSA